jgi:Mg2+/Co2+ transporter CorB
MSLPLILVCLFFAASALFSGLETGGYLLNRIRLRFRARQGNRAAQRLQTVLSDAHRFIFTVLICNNIANYLLSREVTRIYLGAGVGLSGDLLFGFLPWDAGTAATLTLMLPVFFFAELVPKNMFRHHADRLMYTFSGIPSADLAAEDGVPPADRRPRPQRNPQRVYTLPAGIARILFRGNAPGNPERSSARDD